MRAWVAQGVRSRITAAARELDAALDYLDNVPDPTDEEHAAAADLRASRDRLRESLGMAVAG